MKKEEYEEYKEKIDNLIKSDEFTKLKEEYNRETIFDILGATVDEKIQSATSMPLKWLNLIECGVFMVEHS